MKPKPLQGDRRPGRILVRADDPSLTPYGGLVIVGELARRLRLTELIDAELALERRARPVKRRRRGLSPGQLLVSVAEAQLVGADFFADVEDLRADAAGAPLRAVAGTPSASAALQNAKRFRRVHVQRAERALAAAGERLDRALGRDLSEPVTIDLDATLVSVYGRKQGAARGRRGSLAYAPHVAFWAERGRALSSELADGKHEKLTGAECARIMRRALALLPAGHGPVTFRGDSAYYRLELLEALRGEQDWQQAREMAGAEVAETSYTPSGWQHEPLRLIVRRVPFSAAQLAGGEIGSRRQKTIPAEQLQLALDGASASLFGYSFILTDIRDRDAVTVEHFHRQRAQIEERLKEAKLGQALRHLPSANQHANRLWLTAALTALNLTCFCCDLCPACRASGAAAHDAPLRRAAKTLRRLLFCVPARIIRSGRRLTLRLPAGFRHKDTFTDTLAAVYALPP